MKGARAIAALALVAAGGLGWWALGREAGPTPPTAEDIARAATLRPDNPALAAIYDRSCMACHAVVDAQAPLAGHVGGWRWRWQQRGGLDGLVESARNGFGNMPAMGLCADCTDAELRGLIGFMAGEGAP